MHVRFEHVLSSFRQRTIKEKKSTLIRRVMKVHSVAKYISRGVLAELERGISETREGN